MKKSLRPALRGALGIVVCNLSLMLFCRPASAEVGTWISNTDGDWSNADNWDAIPNSATAEAIFGSSIGNRYTEVRVNTPVQLNALRFKNTGRGEYLIEAKPGETLRLTGATNTIWFSSGGEISAPLRIENSDVNIGADDGKRGKISGSISEVGKRKLSITGTGEIELTGNNQHSGGTYIQDATVFVSSNRAFGAPRPALTLANAKLHINGGGDYNSRTIVLLGTRNTITNEKDSPLVFESEIRGGGASDVLTLNDGGSEKGFVLRGANTFEATVNVTGVGLAALTIDSDAALGKERNWLKFSQASHAQLTFENNVTTSRLLQLNLAGIGTNRFSIDTQQFDVKYEGYFDSLNDNTYAFSKVGSGSLTITKELVWEGSMNVADGRLVVDGSIAPTDGLLVNGVLKGSGEVKGKTYVHRRGRVAPGKSVGELHNLGDVEFEVGAEFELEVSSANGSPGSLSGWDLWSVDGALLLPSVGAEPVELNLVSMLPDGQTPGFLADFDPSQSYSWPFLTTTGGVVGFQPDLFHVDTDAFHTGTSFGQFRVEQVDQSLALTYSPIPEPTSAALLVVGLALVVAVQRRVVAGASGP